jgi:hypothetical protein
VAQRDAVRNSWSGFRKCFCVYDSAIRIILLLQRPESRTAQPQGARPKLPKFENTVITQLIIAAAWKSVRRPNQHYYKAPYRWLAEVRGLGYLYLHHGFVYSREGCYCHWSLVRYAPTPYSAINFMVCFSNYFPTGIGKATAITLSKGGYHVVLVARREPELRTAAQECPTESLVIAGDATDETFARKVFDEAVRKFGIVTHTCCLSSYTDICMAQGGWTFYST